MAWSESRWLVASGVASAATADVSAFADPERLTIIALLLLFLAGFKSGTWVMGRELIDQKKLTQDERERSNKYEAIVMRLVGVAENILHTRSEGVDRRVP